MAVVNGLTKERIEELFDAIDTLLASKAPVDSPALIGTPTAPTASTSDSDTSIATTAFVHAVVDALIASAPGALNTLDELAAALGDDASFASTVTTLLAAKAPSVSPVFTGNPTAPTPSPGDDDTSIATTAFVAAALVVLGLTKADLHPTLNTQTGTSYTLVLADDGKVVTLNNASAIALTVPQNSSVAFPVGTTILLVALGAGQVTVGGSGITFVARGSALKSAGQYASITLLKLATDTWLVTGDVTT